MRLFLANGTRVTKSTFPTTAIPAADLPKVISADILETKDYGAADPKPEGSIKTVKFKAGQVLTQRQIDALFDTATIVSVSPASGTTVGGTVVTIKGTHLDGVTSVTFGGTAGTALTVVSPRELKVTTPVKTAGAVTVAVVDDGGSVSKATGYTYA